VLTFSSLLWRLLFSLFHWQPARQILEQGLRLGQRVVRLWGLSWVVRWARLLAASRVLRSVAL
jgi:hypothetical protein